MGDRHDEKWTITSDIRERALTYGHSLSKCQKVFFETLECSNVKRAHVNDGTVGGCDFRRPVVLRTEEQIGRLPDHRRDYSVVDLSLYLDTAIAGITLESPTVEWAALQPLIHSFNPTNVILGVVLDLGLKVHLRKIVLIRGEARVPRCGGWLGNVRVSDLHQSQGLLLTSRQRKRSRNRGGTVHAKDVGRDNAVAARGGIL